jgi:galactokinase
VIDPFEDTLKPFRFPQRGPSFSFYVVHSGEERRLMNSPYNQRVLECEEAARALGAEGESPRLRAVSQEIFRRRRTSLPEICRKRCEHFFSEVQRVRRGASLFASGDFEGFGQLMNASSESLRRDFDVGTPATELLVGILRKVDGVLGASFSGGGFGGSVQAVGAPGIAERIAGQVQEQYGAAFPEFSTQVQVYELKIHGGPKYG